EHLARTAGVQGHAGIDWSARGSSAAAYGVAGHDRRHEADRARALARSLHAEERTDRSVVEAEQRRLTARSRVTDSHCTGRLSVDARHRGPTRSALHPRHNPSRDPQHLCAPPGRAPTSARKPHAYPRYVAFRARTTGVAPSLLVAAYLSSSSQLRRRSCRLAGG